VELNDKLGDATKVAAGATDGPEEVWVREGLDVRMDPLAVMRVTSRQLGKQRPQWNAERSTYLHKIVSAEPMLTS